MNSREKILQAVAQNKRSANQSEPTPLPQLDRLAREATANFADDVVQRFSQTLTNIGGQVVRVKSLDEIADYIRQQYQVPELAKPHRVITTLPELLAVAEVDWIGQGIELRPAHDLANVELAVIRAHFGVAENGAVWLTESLLSQHSLQQKIDPVRVVPFIAQHLAVVLDAADILPTMHNAYERIGSTDYNFGVFVAGPSKTADIEQSLVLGAHGPKTMTVFLLT